MDPVTLTISAISTAIVTAIRTSSASTLSSRATRHEARVSQMQVEHMTGIQEDWRGFVANLAPLGAGALMLVGLALVLSAGRRGRRAS